MIMNATVKSVMEERFSLLTVASGFCAGDGANSSTIKCEQRTTDYAQSTIHGAGGSGAHENVQPTVFVPYIVCLDG